MTDFTLKYFGDQALLVEGPKTIDVAVNQKLIALKQQLETTFSDADLEVVCTYQSMAVYAKSKPLVKQLYNTLGQWIREDDLEVKSTKTKTVRIPVCYDASLGWDMDKVAQKAKIDPEEVVRKHTAPKYHVYFIGFLPGFPYLGGLDPSIATPRLTSPRREIQPGAVGIAGDQTGIYPVASPGGWNIIGQTPVPLFTPYQDEITAIAAGDKVEFNSIEKEEYDRILEKVKDNKFQIEVIDD